MRSVQEAPEEKLEVLRRRAAARPVEGCCCPSFDYATTSNGAADESENKNASPAILEGVTVATTPTGTERPIPRDRRGNFDRSERGDRTGSKGAGKLPMVSLFFVTKTRDIGTTIRPSRTPNAFAAERGTTGRPPIRAGLGVRTISMAAGVFLALATIGHAQSRSGILWRAEPPRPRLVVEPQPIAADGARQMTQGQTAHSANPGTVQSRNVDLELQQLYDEMMRRALVPLEELR
jgi:hypothetical protein